MKNDSNGECFDESTECNVLVRNLRDVVASIP